MESISSYGAEVWKINMLQTGRLNTHEKWTSGVGIMDIWGGPRAKRDNKQNNQRFKGKSIMQWKQNVYFGIWRG